MPAVQAISPADPLRIDNIRRTLVWVGKGLQAKVPCAVVVVFRARSIDGRQRISVDEDHVIAFAKPTILVLQNGLCYADEMPSPRGFEEYVIVLPIRVLSFVNAGTTVIDPVVGPTLTRRSLPVLGVKASDIGWNAGQFRVVDGVVETAGTDAPLVGDGDFGSTLERHLEVRIQRFDGGHCQQCGMVDKILTQPQSKEIAYRRLD